MKAPFPKWSQTALKLISVSLLLFVLGGPSLATIYDHSESRDGVGREIAQPIPFSHLHHVQGLGLDCR